MNKRDQLLRRARKSRTTKVFGGNIKSKETNAITKLKKRKHLYHHRVLNDTRLNPRKFWKAIKSIFPSKPNSANSTSNHDTMHTKVQQFGHYFANVARELKSKAFPLVNFAWRHNNNTQALRTNEIFKFSFVSTIFVEKELRSLKRSKATGIDDLPPNLIKDCATVIAKPLAHIINLSIKSSTVPALWKSAKVKPIFKSGDSDLVENFRPISILPIFSKILEKAIHRQFYNFLENNKLLNDCQFGFRRNRSTKLAATLFCDKIRKEMDNGKLIGCVYLDLSKAFDTIGHGILLDKLPAYGVEGPELAWFTDYLLNRTQFVEMQNNCSRPSTITTGVPQGSILGPLMFIVFFNDLKESVKNSEIIKYADDTAILYADKDAQNIEDALNEDMNLIRDYCYHNELLLNLKKGKTEVMLFGTSQRLRKVEKT
jgi:hypothetical protein